MKKKLLVISALLLSAPAEGVWWPQGTLYFNNGKAVTANAVELSGNFNQVQGYIGNITGETFTVKELITTYWFNGPGVAPWYFKFNGSRVGLINVKIVKMGKLEYIGKTLTAYDVFFVAQLGGVN